MIQIETGSAKPMADQILDQFRVKIASGQLVAGDKLPSVRDLAFQLSLNSKTIARAYAKLTELGLTQARKGLGLFVCEPQVILSEAQQLEQLDEALDIFMNHIIGLDFSTEQLTNRLNHKLDKFNRQGQED
ncbi:MAG: GntR family transcriptional regulator [Algicola sp.]|nr:GntR family transcriptional regulator [Algicola sp.]